MQRVGHGSQFHDTRRSNTHNHLSCLDNGTSIIKALLAVPEGDLDELLLPLRSVAETS
jgi:hypothetical protein